jgi:hypothetical protein
MHKRIWSQFGPNVIVLLNRTSAKTRSCNRSILFPPESTATSSVTTTPATAPVPARPPRRTCTPTSREPGTRCEPVTVNYNKKVNYFCKICILGEPLWLGGRVMANKRENQKILVFTPQPGTLLFIEYVHIRKNIDRKLFCQEFVDVHTQSWIESDRPTQVVFCFLPKAILFYNYLELNFHRL